MPDEQAVETPTITGNRAEMIAQETMAAIKARDAAPAPKEPQGDGDPEEEKPEIDAPEPQGEEGETPEEGQEAGEDDKIKRVEDKVNKRKAELNAEIGQLVAKQKALEERFGNVDVDAITSEIAELRAQLAELKKPKEETDRAGQLKKMEADRLDGYQAEDHEKPREEKREMTREELEDWMAEDQVGAHEWLVRRESRRERERAADEDRLRAQINLTEFEKKQDASRQKLFGKFPDIQASIEKGKQLSAQGKTHAEIHAALGEDNPNFKAMMDIVAENPKYLEMVDGPERVAAEIEKRAAGKTGKVYTEEDIKKAREEAAQMERERINSVDAGMTAKGGKSVAKADPGLQEAGRLMREATKFSRYQGGKVLGEKEYKQSLERRNTIPGANVR